MKDVMLDLETLGTRPGSVILSIGAVAFDYETGELGDSFYQVISVVSCCVAGLRGDEDTLAWWKEQRGPARYEHDKAFGMAPGDVEELTKTLEAFSSYLHIVGGPEGAAKVRLWGNGAAFDNALLAEAYHRAGLTPAWKFYNDRCFRTLKNLPGVKERCPEPEREVGEPHHALHDARHQALWAMKVLRYLRYGRVKEPQAVSVGVEYKESLSRAPLATQEIMPDPPAGYVDALRHKTAREWPMCGKCSAALAPTTLGFVCPKCDEA